MELIESRYYQPNKLNNVTYLVFMALEKYFGQEIFKNDLSRIIYSSSEFAFRQRINKLYPSLTPPYTSITASQMQFPFANYFRNSSWRIDSRPAIQNATAALYGFSISNEIPVPIRFLQTEMDFDFNFYFNRDDDAQNCYDILMWIQNPTPKQFSFPGLKYKNYSLDIPIILKTENITWTNQFKENDWLNKNRVIVVSATINVKTTLVDQFAPGSVSALFDVMPSESEMGQFYITKESILDFLSYKNDPLWNEENIVMDITAQFTPDPQLEATFEIEVPDETSVVFTWDFNEEALEFYEDKVLILLNDGTQIYVPIEDKTYTLSPVSSNSTFIASIYFTSKDGKIIKLTETFETVDPDDQKDLKGMIGLTF